MAEKDPTPFDVLSVTAGDDVDSVADVESTGTGHLTRHDPPVVARLVVEIRSDGSRTIARGALEDLDSGEVVTVEAHGRSPASLAWSLAKTLVKAPAWMRHRPTRKMTQAASDLPLIESGHSPEPRNKLAGVFGRLRTHIKKKRHNIYGQLKRRVADKQDIDIDDRLDSSE